MKALIFLLCLSACLNVYGRFQKLKVGQSEVYYSGDNIFMYNMPSPINATSLNASQSNVTSLNASLANVVITENVLVNANVSDAFYEKVKEIIGYKKIVIFYDGPINIIGRNYFIEQARTITARNLLLDFTYVESVLNDKIEALVDQYVPYGVDLFIATSGNTQNNIRFSANKYRNVTFISSTGNNLTQYISDNKLTNLYLYNLAYGTLQLRYIAGLLAGMTTKTGHACYITNYDAASQTSYVNAFYLGMYNSNPNAQLHVYNTKSFDNITVDLYAFSLCRSQYPLVDVLTTQTNNIDVLNVSTSAGIKSINQGIDLRPFLGEKIIGTIIQDWYTIINLALLFNPNVTKKYTFDVSMGNNAAKFIYDSQLIPIENKKKLQGFIETVSSSATFDLSCTQPARDYNANVNNRQGCLNNTILNTVLLPNITILKKINVPGIEYHEVYVPYNDPLGVIVIVIACILLVLQSGVLIYIVYNRKNSIIQKAVYPVLLAVCIGNIVGTISLFFLIGKPTGFTCNAHIILCMLGFTLVYSCILLKTFRVSLYIKNIGRDVIIIKNETLMVLAGGLVCIDIVIFIGMMLLSPFGPILKDSPLAPSIHHHFIYCKAKFDTGFIITIFSLNGVKMLVLFFLSNSIKMEVAKSFTDTASVKYSSFLLVVIFIFTIFIYSLSELTPEFKTVFIFVVTVLIILTSGISMFYSIMKSVSNSKTVSSSRPTNKSSQKTQNEDL